MAAKAVEDAADTGLDFLRVGITGFAPQNLGGWDDLQLWKSDPGQFWTLFDKTMDQLDQAGIRLVPTFVWNVSQFPSITRDTVGEFIRNPNSKSRQLLDQFVTEFIDRYKNRKTILFYELANELNLAADVDLSSHCQTAGPCVWSNFTTADMLQFSQQIVALIRSLDPSRLISSGYSIPRPAAWHLMQQPEFAPGGADWTPDTFTEFSKYMVLTNGPFDIVSIHLYPGPWQGRFGLADGEWSTLIADAAGIAHNAGKPLFLGEFGDADGATQFMSDALSEIIQDKVDYAAPWAWEWYEGKWSEPTYPMPTDIEPGYSDTLIHWLEQTEGKIGMAPPASRSGGPRVVLTWPLPCAAVTSPTELEAVASDGALGPAEVAFLVDGELLSTVAAPPFEAPFDPSGFGNKAVQIIARAYDKSGTTAEFGSTVRLNAAASTPCSQ